MPGPSPERREGDAQRLADLLVDAPTSWGRWGPDDEVGALNALTADQVRAGAALVREGAVHTLGVPLRGDGTDPVLPGRRPPVRTPLVDQSSFSAGVAFALPGGLAWADDAIAAPIQFGTHCDALGHMWFDDRLWNGFPARSTAGRLRRAGIGPVAARGVAGRGVLVDVARYRGVDSLGPDDEVGLDELLAAAAAAGTEIAPRAVLVVRTGWLPRLVAGLEPIDEGFREPGLVYSRALVEWFHERQIPCLVTDTLGNEHTVDPRTGIWYTLHAALMRNLGVLFTEAAWLEGLAAACAADGRHEFFYCAAPIPIDGASGAPVNPLAIR